jgi:hypothetical protein
MMGDNCLSGESVIIYWLIEGSLILDLILAISQRMKMEVYETISFIGILILDPKKKEVRACPLYLLRY